MSEVTEENMLFHLKHGCSFYPVCPICNAIRVLIEEHGKLVERLEKKIEELAKENYKLKEGDDEW